MPTRRSAQTAPDLFSAPPTAKAPEPLAAPRPRHFLPKDLAGALKRLDNAEIDALLAAVTTEAERRGRLSPTSRATPQPREAPATLTTGKLNAVRAAFKAGVKPSAIARQFGISQSDVRKVLAEGRDRKSGR
jgi:DNA invertase Pin-like site-specific DNA recombinase